MTNPLDIVKRFYSEVRDAGNLALIPEICDPKMTFRGSLGETQRGPAGFAEYVIRVRGSLGGYRCIIEEAVVEDDRVFARMLFSGTHRTSFMGYAATHKVVRWAGAALFTVHANRIVDLWVLGDVHGLIAQLAANAEARSR